MWRAVANSGRPCCHEASAPATVSDGWATAELVGTDSSAVRNRVSRRRRQGSSTSRWRSGSGPGAVVSLEPPTRPLKLRACGSRAEGGLTSQPKRSLPSLALVRAVAWPIEYATSRARAEGCLSGNHQAVSRGARQVNHRLTQPAPGNGVYPCAPGARSNRAGHESRGRGAARAHASLACLIADGPASRSARQLAARFTLRPNRGHHGAPAAQIDDVQHTSDYSCGKGVRERQVGQRRHEPP